MVELLVVLAVIVLLAAIIFPVFAKARARGRQTTCVANLRSLTAATIMYAGDYDGRLPYSHFGVVAGPPGTMWYAWDDALRYYVADDAITVCPSAKLDQDYTRSYGMWHHPDIPHPIRLSRAKRPATTVLFADRTPSTHADPCVFPPSHPNPTTPRQRPEARHLGMANFAMYDGHVKAMQPMATESPEYMWDLQ